MPNYRRAFVPGGSYFFTVVTHQRQPIFQHALARKLLGQVLRECQRDWPFEVAAIVLLPDHLHAIWTLPPGDARYSARWSRIKLQFTKAWLAAGGSQGALTAGMRRERRRAVWQRRFWEHTIEEDDDYQIRFDYIHFNPVKHGYVKCPRDWEATSFHRWVDRGVYEENWACGQTPPPDFRPVEQSSGEPPS